MKDENPFLFIPNSEQITFNDNQLKFPEKRILYRNDRNERFGLTLSYEYQWKKQLKIYIEKIDENSLADLDGHFQVGDEIIRINNRAFSNRDQAIELISQHSFLILEIIPSKVDFRFRFFSKEFLRFVSVCQSKIFSNRINQNRR